MKILYLSIAIFILNIPFGYWRASTKKFSLQWVLAIHLPVPVVIALRIFSGIGWQLATFPILISVFFLGQFFGGKLNFKN